MPAGFTRRPRITLIMYEEDWSGSGRAATVPDLFHFVDHAHAALADECEDGIATCDYLADKPRRITYIERFHAA